MPVISLYTRSERLSVMQRQARLREFFVHFGQNTLFWPGKNPPGLELFMEDLESLALILAESTPPPAKCMETICCTPQGYRLVTACKRRLGQGNLFTPVCDSVHRGGWCTHPQADTPTHGHTHPPPSPSWPLK